MTYKIPREKAIELAGCLDLPNMTRCVVGGIKTFNEVYEYRPDTTGSLAKRIVHSIKHRYARLIVDRMIVDWLCKNRIDLSTIEGELRNYVVNRIMSDKQ